MDVEAFRRKIEERAAANRASFEGEYGAEIRGLLGLSRVEIDMITPDDTTDIETYDHLISVVKEASAANIAQADLKDRITELGQVGISIAMRVPRLAALL